MTHPRSEGTGVPPASWTIYDVSKEIDRDMRGAAPLQALSGNASENAAQQSLRRIRLELNKSAEYPNGCHGYGFEFVAPLNSRRHIDLQQWQILQRFCHVRSFQPGREDRFGRLILCTGDDDIGFWAFDDGTQPGGSGHTNRFGAHAFVPGEYVTIRNAGAREDLFRVVAVSTLR